MKFDPDKIRSWARIEPQPDVERRVLAAVICEADKLAIAGDLELGDFTEPSHRYVFEALRNLQSNEQEITATALAEFMTLDGSRRGTSSADLSNLHHRSLDAIGKILAAPVYETAFGWAAAIHVFEADLRRLRLIAQERRA